MIQTDDCRFCRILDGHRPNGDVDIPFLSSSEYVAIASVGALVEGWSLVVPREHCLSLRNHYGTPNFAAFTRKIVDQTEFEYGPTVIFEHGANHCGSLTACGTDHAHLHIVPIHFSLAEFLDETGISSWQRVRASEIAARSSGAEYLFLSDSPSEMDPVGYFKEVTNPSSQFFRKAIAHSLGKGSVADYRQFPHIELSLRTRERLAKTA